MPCWRLLYWLSRTAPVHVQVLFNAHAWLCVLWRQIHILAWTSSYSCRSSLQIRTKITVATQNKICHCYVYNVPKIWQLAKSIILDYMFGLFLKLISTFFTFPRLLGPCTALLSCCCLCSCQSIIAILHLLFKRTTLYTTCTSTNFINTLYYAEIQRQKTLWVHIFAWCLNSFIVSYRIVSYHITFNIITVLFINSNKSLTLGYHHQHQDRLIFLPRGMPAN